MAGSDRMLGGWAQTYILAGASGAAGVGFMPVLTGREPGGDIFFVGRAWRRRFRSL